MDSLGFGRRKFPFDFDDCFTALGYLACVVALVAFLCAFSGCACFTSSKVEARASYNILADDCEVSLVAVGYVNEK